jgi:hypothetical protein
MSRSTSGPRWLRRQIAGVPLAGAGLAERRDLLERLDALAGPGEE